MGVLTLGSALAADDVQVEVLDQPQGAPVIRGTTVLEAPVPAVREVLLDLPSYPRFMPNTLAAEWVPLPGGKKGSYLHYHFPWPLSDRDSVSTFEAEDLPGGGMRLTTHDIVVPERPARDGLVRLTPLRSLWTLEPKERGTKTRVVYEYLGELGGNIPDVLLQYEWNQQPVRVLNALGAEVARRFAPDAGARP